MFYISRDENVYFNIREKMNVIQASFRGGGCNSLFIF